MSWILTGPYQKGQISTTERNRPFTSGGF